MRTGVEKPIKSERGGIVHASHLLGVTGEGSRAAVNMIRTTCGLWELTASPVSRDELATRAVVRALMYFVWARYSIGFLYALVLILFNSRNLLFPSNAVSVHEPIHRGRGGVTFACLHIARVAFWAAVYFV